MDDRNVDDRPVRAVLFDFGGTLSVLRGQPGAVRRAFLAARGADVDSPDFTVATQTAAAQVSRRYAALPAYLHRDLFRDVYLRCAELLDVDVADSLDDFDEANRRSLIEAFDPRPDALDVLTRLGAEGVHRSVVSNADDDLLVPSLERCGFDVELDAWTSSQEADSCKPDPAIFEAALAKAGVPAEAALFVGDSLQHDVAGAAAAGMRTVLIGDAAGPAPFSDGLEATAVPDFEVTTLGGVFEIVQQLNRPR